MKSFAQFRNMLLSFLAGSDDGTYLNNTDNSKKFQDLDLSLYKNNNKKTKVMYLGSVWGMTILKFVMLLSDIYTCTKLLAFNIWSNDYVQPFVPFRISRWLFGVCIIISIVLLIWDLLNGIKVYKTRIISLNFINNWSRIYCCLKDYRIYCLFDKITPSGFEQKLTFLVFFELKTCFRLLFADSPRQIINGLTLWSVLLLKDESRTNLKDFNSLNGIYSKIKWIAKNNHSEMVILSFMFLSFLIWFIFMLKFIVAIIAFIKIHYTLKYNSQFHNIKEYVCVTVIYNIEYLTEKYCFKKFYSQVSSLGKGANKGAGQHDRESITSSEFFNEYYTDEDDDNYSFITSTLEESIYNKELNRIIFSKTPDTLNTIPSYYYITEKEKDEKLFFPTAGLISPVASKKKQI